LLRSLLQLFHIPFTILYKYKGKWLRCASLNVLLSDLFHISLYLFTPSNSDRREGKAKAASAELLYSPNPYNRIEREIDDVNS